ncbi:hypothetical protein ACHHYP_05672 [Achlya hypogyna]|uniref:Tubby C-terminal domain-containing protein n=1 Tax=Achlya hypogyna TaxID=1202772 RepID=A0A1V9YWW0_ACHHY|nr:hypothetical protein ACHHYP_05672 [Achlya hypogyna]
MGACESFEAAQTVPPVAQKRIMPQRITVFDPKFVADRVVTLDMKGKIWTWSGEDFVIRDASTGDAYFKIDAKALSFSNKKRLLDNVGHTVAVLKKDLVAFTLTQRVYRNDEAASDMFAIKTRIKIGLSEVECTIQDLISHRSYDINCKGNWTGRRATITCNGNVIAKLRQPLELGGNRYLVDVNPGVDIALITLICIAMDENERN